MDHKQIGGTGFLLDILLHGLNLENFFFSYIAKKFIISSFDLSLLRLNVIAKILLLTLFPNMTYMHDLST